MRFLLSVFTLIFISIVTFGQPVFRNPGIPASESFEITDYINGKIGFVTAKINISLKERNGQKYYSITANEGNIYLNEMEINYYDLTTISEKRIDLRTNSIVEHYTNPGNNIIHFFNKEKNINKNFYNKDRNIYIQDMLISFHFGDFLLRHIGAFHSNRICSNMGMPLP